ncbi:Nucleoid occlusion protein [subsurface metagenome]
MKKQKAKKYQEVLITEIDPPAEVDRLEISAITIEELSESIREIGLLSPVLLSRSGERYEIVFGHRRYLACRRLGWEKITAQVVDYTKKQISLARATENIQREDLTPVEEGIAYARLIKDLGMKIAEVSAKTGKSAGLIKRRIEILRMPEGFQRALHARKITVVVAEELWSCGDEAHREYLLEMAVDHGVTQAVARQWVQDFRKAARKRGIGTEGGGREPVVGFEEKIYRSCDICRGPVELAAVKELRLCGGCYEQIINAMTGKGG